MFFYFSKTLSFFLDPANLMFLALTGGTVLLWTRHKYLARWWLSVTVIIATCLAVFPVGRLMFNVLENRFETPKSLPGEIEGVIVLGGVVDQFLSKNRGITVINGASERMTAFADFADRYPEAKLIFTGGSGVLWDQSLKEADFVAPLLQRLGVSMDRVIFENKSRNTAENASMSRQILSPGPNGTWVLITSAFHMPRAVGVFRKNGWELVPYPVDYVTRREVDLTPRFAVRAGLNNLASAVHEWAGLTFYWLTGRTNEFFPGPGFNIKNTGE